MNGMNAARGERNHTAKATPEAEDLVDHKLYVCFLKQTVYLFLKKQPLKNGDLDLCEQPWTFSLAWERQAIHSSKKNKIKIWPTG